MAYHATPTPTPTVAATVAAIVAAPMCFSFASTATSFCFKPHYRVFVVVLCCVIAELAVMRDVIPLMAVMSDLVVVVVVYIIYL